jgi:hypothetical protein
MREATEADITNRQPNGQFGRGNTAGRLHIGQKPTNGFQIGNTYGSANKGRPSWIKGKDIKNDPKYADYRRKMSIAAQARARRENRQTNRAMTPSPTPEPQGLIAKIKGAFGIIG